MKKDKVLIRFKRQTAPYLPGETAAFTEDVALRYVQVGAAELVEKPPAGSAAAEVSKEAETIIEGFTLSQFDLKASREPVHVGGGNFDVAGVRVKGKAKAMKIVEALAALEST